MKILRGFVATIVVVCTTAIVAVDRADASAVPLPFPAVGTSFSSFANGTGTIPLHGTSAALFTAGDDVDETFTGTGVTSVNSLKVDFDVDDLLNGTTEKVSISINGFVVGSFTVLDNSGVHSVQTISGSIFFAPIVGNGTYELTMTLEDTVPAGEGSIDFRDGGVFALNGGVHVVAVPEPISFWLFGAGLGAVIAVQRRRSSKARVR